MYVRLECLLDWLANTVFASCKHWLFVTHDLEYNKVTKLTPSLIICVVISFFRLLFSWLEKHQIRTWRAMLSTTQLP